AGEATARRSSAAAGPKWSGCSSSSTAQSARTSACARIARPDSSARFSSSERSRWRPETPARAAAAAARAPTTPRGTETPLPARSISIISSRRTLDLWPRLRRTERVELGPAYDVEPLSVGHYRRERAVGIRPDLLPRECVEPVCTPLERREVDDPVDHGRGARDRAVRVELPQHGSRRRIDGVAVVG